MVSGLAPRPFRYRAASPLRPRQRARTVIPRIHDLSVGASRLLHSILVVLAAIAITRVCFGGSGDAPPSYDPLVRNFECNYLSCGLRCRISGVSLPNGQNSRVGSLRNVHYSPKTPTKHAWGHWCPAGFGMLAKLPVRPYVPVAIDVHVGGLLGFSLR